MNYDYLNLTRFKDAYKNYKTYKQFSFKDDDILLVRSEKLIAVHSVGAIGLQVPFGKVKRYFTDKVFEEILDKGSYILPYTNLNGSLLNFYTSKRLTLPEGFTLEDIKDSTFNPWAWVVFCEHAGFDPQTVGF